MDFDDTFVAGALPTIYVTFGVDATVTRGIGPAVPVRIVVDRGQERVGEYGQVVARVDEVHARVAEWEFRQGDVVAWTDRLGSHSKAVESASLNDGLESTAVLHG